MKKYTIRGENTKILESLSFDTPEQAWAHPYPGNRAYFEVVSVETVIKPMIAVTTTTWKEA